MLKYIYTKLKNSRIQTGWLEKLGYCGNFPITLKAGKVHVLEGAL